MADFVAEARRQAVAALSPDEKQRIVENVWTIGHHFQVTMPQSEHGSSWRPVAFDGIATKTIMAFTGTSKTTINDEMRKSGNDGKRKRKFDNDLFQSKAQQGVKRARGVDDFENALAYLRTTCAASKSGK